MTWTRKHDAWLVRECEGLDVWVNARDGAICEYQDASISCYNTDPAARIRAAEAWRNQKPGRSYETRSRIDDEFGTQPASAVCFSRTNQIAGGGQGESALAQALIRATGGPA